MGIRNDAGKILAYIYKEYVSSTIASVHVRIEDLVKATGWERSRVERAVDYLRDRSYVRIMAGVGSSSGITAVSGISPDGIDVVENATTFKTTFGINVGVLSLSVTKGKK